MFATAFLQDFGSSDPTTSPSLPLPMGGPGWAGPLVWSAGPESGPSAEASPQQAIVRRATVVAALLLEAPATAAELVERVTAATDGAIAPPVANAELTLGFMAGRGLVTISDGTAALTELGRNILAWRGVNADTARAILGRFAQLGDLIQIRKALLETATLGKTITTTGTAEQKAALAEAKAAILASVLEAKKSLYAALGT